jgi:hypothetical protein
MKGLILPTIEVIKHKALREPAKVPTAREVMFARRGSFSTGLLLPTYENSAPGTPIHAKKKLGNSKEDKKNLNPF